MSGEGREGGGGGEEEEQGLSQMIRDYIELESSNPSSYFSSKSLVVDQKSSTYLSLQEILENVTVSEVEILGKILIYLGDLESKKQQKLIVIRLGLDHYQAYLCTTSWITTSRCPSRLHTLSPKHEYEYIEVIPKKENGGAAERLIVDIDFRSQFELVRPTPTYEELWNSLPPMFIGTEEKLEKIISLLCSAAKESLRERGLHIPPWRKTSYMHSKWLSHNCKKIPFLELAAKSNISISK